MNAPPMTFLWHDYETFGANPRYDRPAQFAAVRTDMALNPVGQPLSLYCRPANDYLPDAQACLITGITPQLCLQKGVAEHRFAREIEAAMAWPGTVGVGYNTIRFDDEVTRFMLWRNLTDPYAREWQNNCGRWDLLDVVRAAWALRPEGLVWPKNAQGKASFKLGDLTTANGLPHDSAHDAMSDVTATLALARLIKAAQPRLFEFCFALHRKERVAQELGLPTSLSQARPFLHVSGMFPTEHGCLALMWPLAMHPVNRNELLAWDLRADPSELADLDAERIRERLFTRTTDLPEGVSRLPVKSVHLNRSPMVFSNLKVLSPAMAAQWQIDLEAQLGHAALARDLPDMSAIWEDVFTRPAQSTLVDVDQDLYGGFLSPADRRRLTELRDLSGADLARARPAFEDARLAELLWRYRARNFPQSLSPEDLQRWDQERGARLINGEGGARTVDQFFDALDALAESVDERGQAILDALYAYAEDVVPER